MNKKDCCLKYEWWRSRAYKTFTGNNGQILFKMARKELGGETKVGIGFAHNDDTNTSYIVVQYEKGKKI